MAAVGKHGDEDQLKGESVHEDTSSRDFFILCGGVVKSVILLIPKERCQKYAKRSDVSFTES